jgi:mannosyltransferase
MSAWAERRAPLAALFALGALVALALLLRLPSFSGALWGDELATNYVVNGFGVESFGSILVHGKEATPPLFFLLTWLTKAFDGAEGLRLVSLLAGLAAIPLTYLAGRETVGRPAAVVAAALVTLSPFLIFYATEARAYALLMFCCLLATFTLLRALHSGGTGWWIAYGASTAAAMYTHYVAVYALAGLFVWAFVAHPEARRPLLLANLGGALLFAPWIPQFVDDTGKQAAKNIELIHPLSVGQAKTDLLRMWFGSPLLDVNEVPGNVALALIGASFAVGAVGAAVRLRSARRWRPSSGLILIAILAVAVPVGAALHNLVAPSIFTPRNLIASWPGFALLVGALVTAGPPAIRIASVALLMGGFGIGAAEMVDETTRRPDIVAAANYIEQTGDPGSPVVDMPQFTPGPQTAFEAALAPKGEGLPTDRFIFELGLPSFADRLELNRKGESFSQAGAPVSPQEIASRAARFAGDGGTLFVIGPPVPLAAVRAFPGPLSSFLAALPPRFHEVESRRFPGPSIFGIGVHVLSDAPAGRP